MVRFRKSSAPSPVGDLGLTQMTDALKLDRIKLQTIDADILITGYFNI